MTRDSKESVLSRWSRRKHEAREALDEQTPPVSADDVSVELPPSGAAAEKAEPALTDADMPAIESLTDESDFSPFMSPGVSDELRNLALRKLFRAPVFNIRDGLDEYDDDFTSFEKLGDIVTSDMKHQIEMQQQKLREKLAQEDEARAAEDLEAMEDIEEEIDDGDDDEDREASPLVADATGQTRAAEE